MVKTFHKTIRRMFKNNLARFFANFMIVLISVAISSGLACLPISYQDSFAENYSDGNAPDLVLKETTGKGFLEEDVQRVKNAAGVKEVSSFTSMDIVSGNFIYRFNVLDFSSEIARLDLVEGQYPTDEIQLGEDIPVLVETSHDSFLKSEIGDRFSIQTSLLKLLGYSELDFVVTGVVDSPLYNSVQRENANLQGSSEEVLKKTYVDSVFYIDEKLLPEEISVSNVKIPLSSFLVKTDMYVVYQNKSSYFTKNYQSEMEKRKEEITNLFSDGDVYILTLEENVSYALFKNYNEKVRYISFVFPLFFILVCALVNLITITKLIKDERAMIGTYVSLGISKGKIIGKYLSFTFLSTVLGAISGLLLGIPLIPGVVLPAYGSVFEMNPISLFSNVGWYGFLCAFLIVFAALCVTLFSSASYLKETPAGLMKQKAPKPGKKILLQRITFLWNPLPFRYKSSLRNVFLQKKNLLLTSFSIIGATLLIFAGFALLDVSSALKNDAIFKNVSSSMGLISTVIILFALSMGVVVVYSLAVMNVSDREREIATLKVLGYFDRECLSYTFREIVMISSVSALIGLPVSALIVDLVLFQYLGFGSLSDVNWYSYAFTFLLIVGITLILNFLLYPKIKKIDMNVSLKTLD